MKGIIPLGGWHWPWPSRLATKDFLFDMERNKRIQMLAEGCHGNRVNCDASRQRQRLCCWTGPFVFKCVRAAYFLTDTLSLCNNLFRFLVWLYLFMNQAFVMVVARKSDELQE